MEDTPPSELLELFRTRMLRAVQAGRELSLADLLEGIPAGTWDAAARESVVLRFGAEERHASRENRIGPYVVEEEIGRGGQGIVYRARDTELDRTVAVKVLAITGRLSSPARRRFRREAEAAARLDHEGICPVYAAGDEDGQPWIAMKFVSGRRITEAFAPPRDDRAKRDAILLAVARTARALHYAHEQGVVHRDVKPSNVMVDEDGAPTIVDFGLARVDSDGDEVTISSATPGTPAYMSPEQARGVGIIDRRTDVYSLGVTLFELLTGRRPHQAPTTDALIAAITRNDAPDIKAFGPTAGKDLRAVVRTALERDAAARYHSALGFAEDLERLARNEGVAVRPLGPLRRTVRRCLTHPLRSAMTLAASILLAWAAWTSWLAYRHHQLDQLEAYLQQKEEAAVLLLSYDPELAKPIATRLVEQQRDDADAWLYLVASSFDGRVDARQARREVGEEALRELSRVPRGIVRGPAFEMLADISRLMKEGDREGVRSLSLPSTTTPEEAVRLAVVLYRCAARPGAAALSLGEAGSAGALADFLLGRIRRTEPSLEGLAASERASALSDNPAIKLDIALQMVQLGKGLAREELIAQGLERGRELIKEHPGNPSILHDFTYALQEAKGLEAADEIERNYRRIIRANDSAVSRWNLCNLLFGREGKDRTSERAKALRAECRSLLDGLGETHGHRHEYWRNSAMLEYLAKGPEAAAAELERGVPRVERSHVHLTRLIRAGYLAEAGRRDESAAILAECLHDLPIDAESVEVAASTYLETRRRSLGAEIVRAIDALIEREGPDALGEDSRRIFDNRAFHLGE